MNCTDFRHWLDGGRDETTRGEATAHAAGCDACARADRTDRDLVGLLGQRFASAPEGFTASVLARLPARPARPGVKVPDPYPWYVRVLLEPSTVLALLLGGVYALWAGDLWESLHPAVSGIIGRWLELLAVFPGGIATALAWLSAGLAVLGGSFLVYRLSEIVGDRMLRAGRRASPRRGLAS